MKKIFPDKILNVQGTDSFDNTFLFEYLENISSAGNVLQNEDSVNSTE